MKIGVYRGFFVHVLKILGVIIRILLLAVMYCTLTMLSNSVVPVKASLTAGLLPEDMMRMALFLLLNAVSTSAILAFVVLNARERGWRLAVVLSACFWGILYLLGQIETFIYRDALPILTTRDIMDIILRGAIVTVPYISLTVLILWRRRKTPDEVYVMSTTWRSYAWKVPLLAAVFLMVYLLFGYFVAWGRPEVRQFYSGSTKILPIGEHYAGMFTRDPAYFLVQYFRGILWALCALAIVWLFRGKSALSVAATSLFFLLFGLQLMIPSPFLFPDAVRMAHFYEITSSMLLYGGIAGFVLKIEGHVKPREAWGESK